MQHNKSGSKAPSKKITSNKLSQGEFILKARERAHKLGFTLLRRWGCTMPREDVLSIVDLALCEAASRYQECPQAEFMSYAFYFIKGELIRTIAQRKKISVEILESALLREDDEQSSPFENKLHAESSAISCDTPEKLSYRAQLRLACNQALSSISEAERAVLWASAVEERKMNHVAKKLGYSRGHLFAIRKSAVDNARKHLELNDICDAMMPLAA